MNNILHQIKPFKQSALNLSLNFHFSFPGNFCISEITASLIAKQIYASSLHELRDSTLFSFHHLNIIHNEVRIFMPLKALLLLIVL